ncbi:rubrerythrin family protein [Bacillus wiedmannii]|uniref:ferritin-like domain-containing protein n=1 Tax=Bacillus cereus group TaxID=86661 RepID=UPI0002DA3FAF|nr:MULTISPECIES: ferritin-like domain-containing protein [Bacillus cereus group]KAA0783472.1 ferritin-like domain-containing protein [Bacillus sp. BB081]MCC2379464.1 ferritin-like domain-containing protein [Bacillus wiedmannii]MCC2423507.1 ferritin-like domain-containing protein [Bacillus wiedmannii]PEA77334.1 rubrerythrin family protein [Bacillus wiedmannii]PEG11865.1 rubrerythrin family protein [Bacillus wiedmannii]
MYNSNDYDWYRQNDKLIRDIEKAINGEFSAINCYAKLANMAPNVAERNQILEIRNDEIKHFHQFVQIYTNLTGQQPKPQITEECPNTYLQGLEFAIQDEQKTVDFYLEISDEASDAHLKELLRRIAADEQNHAVWFLYYFVKTK